MAYNRNSDEELGKELNVYSQPHDWWRVEVKLYDGTLLAIEPEMLAGKSDLTERDLETIRAAGRNLLGFAGT